MCDKCQLVRCWFKSHYIVNDASKSLNRYPLRAFYFFLMPLCFGLSEAKHMELILKSLGSISVPGQLCTYPSPNPTCYNKLIS